MIKKSKVSLWNLTSGYFLTGRMKHILKPWRLQYLSRAQHISSCIEQFIYLYLFCSRKDLMKLTKREDKWTIGKESKVKGKISRESLDTLSVQQK